MKTVKSEESRQCSRLVRNFASARSRLLLLGAHARSLWARATMADALAPLQLHNVHPKEARKALVLSLIHI